jgi:S-layer domain
VAPEEENGRYKVTVPMTRHFPPEMVHSSNAPFIVLSGLVLALFLCCAPCLAAGYIYLDTGEQPTLVAQSEGDTRYYPGDTFEMTVLLTNRGRDSAMQVAPLLTPGAYDPSTALGVTVRPGAGDAPVTLKSLPIVAGDIGSWDQVPLTLRGTVHQDASPGVYYVPLLVTYRYAYAIPMVGPDFSTFEILYREKEQVLPVTIRVMSEVRPAVISEDALNMVPGTQGYLAVEVKNIGYATGTEVTLRIVPSDNVTFQMVEDSVYFGRFGPGDTAPVRVRIAVREHTAAGSYPASLEGVYRDADGIFRNTPQVPLGIPVSRGAVIDAVTKDLTIGTGEKETISISYINTGDTPAINAQARIIGNQILVPVTDSASLGTIGPHETRTAQFVLSAQSAIAGKRYVLDTEVKYRDGLDALMLSDKMSFGVDIQQPTGLNAITSNPVILIIIAGVLVILIYAGWKLRRRQI